MGGWNENLSALHYRKDTSGENAMQQQYLMNLTSGENNIYQANSEDKYQSKTAIYKHQTEEKVYL